MKFKDNLFENFSFLEKSEENLKAHYIGAKKAELIIMFMFLVQNEDWASVKNMINKGMIKLENFNLKGELNWNKFSQQEICSILPTLLVQDNNEFFKSHPQYMYNFSSYVGDKLYFELANTLNKLNIFNPEAFYLSAFLTVTGKSGGVESAPEYFNYLINSKAFLTWACTKNRYLQSYIEEEKGKTEDSGMPTLPVFNLIRRQSYEHIDFDTLKEEERYKGKRAVELMEKHPSSHLYPFYLYEKKSLPLENIFYSVWNGFGEGQHLIYINVRKNLTDEAQIKEFKKQMTILMKFFNGLKQEEGNMFTYSNILGAKDKMEKANIDKIKQILQEMIEGDCLDLQLFLDLKPLDFCKKSMEYYVTRNTDILKLVGSEYIDKTILENNLAKFSTTHTNSGENNGIDGKVKNKI